MTEKLRELLEDVQTVYEGKGMVVHPNSFDKLRMEVIKLDNINKQQEGKNMKQKKCKNCKGKGYVPVYFMMARHARGIEDCPVCKGTGKIEMEPKEKRIEELEEKISVLLSCKNCPENKDGLICQKEYENKCLAQKIQFIKELQQENAELKSIAEFQQSSNMNTHFENKKLKEGLAVGSIWNKALNSMNKALEEERDKYRNMVFDKDEQLTKAKEIIEELYNIIPASMSDYAKEPMEHARKFMTEEADE